LFEILNDKKLVTCKNSVAPQKSLLGGKKLGGPKCLILGEKHYFVCDTAAQSAKLLYFRKIWGATRHRRTGRHFTGRVEKIALKITICPKNKQFALKLTF